MLWKANIFSVNITDVSAQMMHCEVEHRGTQHKFQIIFVYGFNDQALRRQLWQELEKIHGVTKKPWAVMGDFNCVLNRDKRVGSPITVSEIKEFKECVGRCSLQELKSSGSFLTWNNKHGDNSRVYSRIDRVLVNGDWVMKLLGSEVHFGNEGLMDHCPALINWDQGPQSGQYRFRYFNIWSQATDFKQQVEYSCNKGITGTKQYRLVGKLNRLKATLQGIRRT